MTRSGKLGSTPLLLQPVHISFRPPCFPYRTYKYPSPDLSTPRQTHASSPQPARHVLHDIRPLLLLPLRRPTPRPRIPEPHRRRQVRPRALRPEHQVLPNLALRHPGIAHALALRVQHRLGVLGRLGRRGAGGGRGIR